MLTAVRQWSEAVAIDVQISFLNIPFAIPFPFVIAKYLGDYFDIRWYGENKTFLLKMSIYLRT